MMRDVAQLERTGIGLTQFQPLNPYDLAAEHGIEVYPIEELADELCSETSVRHFTQLRRSAWSAALIPIGSARVIVENTAHSPGRRRSSIAHELGHHLLEHDFDDVLLTETGCRRFDAEKERQARFLSGELLIPWPAATRAAFDGKTNLEVARAFGVSEQFAQMQMAGPRVLAQRALAKQSHSHPPYAGVSCH
jgi:Zn-dependent peptidase ImmA (M78 family)